MATRGSFEKLINSEKTIMIFWYKSLLFDDGENNDQLDVFDELRESLSDKIKIIKIDVNSEINKELASKEKIRKFPTIQIFKNGEELFISKEFKGFSVLMDIILDSYSTGEKYLEPEKDE